MENKISELSFIPIDKKHGTDHIDAGVLLEKLKEIINVVNGKQCPERGEVEKNKPLKPCSDCNFNLGGVCKHVVECMKDDKWQPKDCKDTNKCCKDCDKYKYMFGQWFCCKDHGVKDGSKKSNDYCDKWQPKDAEKCCTNCKHETKESDTAPCDTCMNSNGSASNCGKNRRNATKRTA